MGRYIVGITGASGSVYAKKLIHRLLALQHDVLVTVTRAGKLVLEQELDLTLSTDPAQASACEQKLRQYFETQNHLFYYDIESIGAPIASGSVSAEAMVVVPCSMATASAIAQGSSRNLLERAADVMLKERRRLVVVPREAPFSTIHLCNLLTLSESGAIVVPACPPFYQRPATMDELLDFFVEHLLVLISAQQEVSRPWQGL